MKKHKMLFALFLASALAVTCLSGGCALGEEEPVFTPTPMPTPEPIVQEIRVTATPTPTPTPTPGPYANWDGKLFSVDTSVKYQTIEGFGAAYTWYSNWVDAVDDQDGLFDALFKDAGLSILRFKNEYEYVSEDKATNAETMKRYYDEAVERLAAQGIKPVVLMSCWSPAAKLKANNDRTGAASLRKNADGTFCYDEYAAWWVESVKYYEAQGVPIDYISLQNEIDFAASYDGCTFSPEETEDEASYAKAFLAVYRAMRAEFGEKAPKMVAPETMSCKHTTIMPYIKGILAEEPGSIDILGYHLYVGGEGKDEDNTVKPNSFINEFMGLNNLYPDMRKWQTEYYVGHGIDTAGVINNYLVYGNGNAYIYWSGTWAEDQIDKMSFENSKLIGMALEKHKRLTTSGWRICADYYALRHFSEFIKPGYVRIKTVTGSQDVLGSSYLSPDGKKLVCVLINTSSEPMEYMLKTDGFVFHDADYVRSVFGETCTSSTKLFENMGIIYPETVITLEPYSVSTIVLQ